MASAPAAAAVAPKAASAPTPSKKRATDDDEEEERRENAAAVAAGGKPKSHEEHEAEERREKAAKKAAGGKSHDDEEAEERREKAAKKAAAAAGAPAGSKKKGSAEDAEDNEKDRAKAYTPHPVSSFAADAAATAALKRKGASKDGLPASQLAAAATGLAPRVVRHKPLTDAETARVKQAFNITGNATLSKATLAALAANRTALLFALADENGDGEVTQAEYLAYAQRDAPKGTNTTDATIPPSVTRLFDRVAGAGAATMNATAAERAGVADAVTAFFLAADTDGSGRVSPEEMAQPLPFTHPGTPAGTQPWLPLAAPMDAETILRVYGWDGDGLMDREEVEALFDDTSAAALSKDARPSFRLVASALDVDGNGRVNETEVVPEDALGEGAAKARAAFKRIAGKNGTLSYDQAAAELDAANAQSHADRAKAAGVKKGDFDAKALTKLAADVPKAAGEPPVKLNDTQAAADVTRYDVSGKGALDRVGYSLWAADTLPPRAASAGGAPRTAAGVANATANITKAGEPEPAK